MKNLLFILFIISPILCFSQSPNISTALGGIFSKSPGVTITQTSSNTEFFRDTIRANTLIPNSYLHYMLECSLTTPALVGIPGLTATFTLGGQTFTAMSSAALVGGVTNGLLTLDCYIQGVGTTTQNIFVHIYQPGTSLLNYTPSTVNQYYTYTANGAADMPFTISMVFTGLSLGTSKLQNLWIVKLPI